MKYLPLAVRLVVLGYLMVVPDLSVTNACLMAFLLANFVITPAASKPQELPMDRIENLEKQIQELRLVKAIKR